MGHLPGVQGSDSHDALVCLRGSMAGRGRVRVATDDRRHPRPGRVRLQASARSDAGEFFVVRGRFLVYFDPDRRLPDVLRGLWRGRAGLLLDVAAGVPGPVHRGALLRRAGGPVSVVGRDLPVVAVDRVGRSRLDGRLGLPERLGHQPGRGCAGLAGDSSPDRAGVSVDW